MNVGECFIGFQTDDVITLEEEEEIIEAVTLILKKDNKKRKVKVIQEIELVGKEV